MRLDLNLASQPYENVRQFVARWTALLAVVGVLSVTLVWTAAASWLRSRQVTREIQTRQDEIARLKQDQRLAEAKLNLPQNHNVREEAAYINELIALKSFSWTEAFNELERMMPTRIHVVSMRPQLTGDNRLELNLSIAGDSRDRAIELLQRLEDSRHFRDANWLGETAEANGAITAQLSAIYVPTPPANAGGSETGAGQ